jgi:hypothetical protein
MAFTCVGLVVLLLADAPKPFDERQAVWTLGSSLNLRAQADAKAPVLLKVPFGSPCIHLERSEPWSRVRCAAKEGWVKTEFLSPTAPDLQALRRKRDELPAGPEQVELAGRLAASSHQDANAFVGAYKANAWERRSQAHARGKVKNLGRYTSPGPCLSDVSACTHDALTRIHPDRFVSYEVWWQSGSDGVMQVTLLRTGEVAVDVGTISGPSANVVTVEQTEKFVPSLGFLEAFGLVETFNNEHMPTLSCLRSRARRDSLVAPPGSPCPTPADNAREAENMAAGVVCVQSCDAQCLECAGACSGACADACAEARQGCLKSCQAEVDQRGDAGNRPCPVVKYCDCGVTAPCLRKCHASQRDGGLDPEAVTQLCQRQCASDPPSCVETCIF